MGEELVYSYNMTVTETVKHAVGLDSKSSGRTYLSFCQGSSVVMSPA